jgi:uncharacterized protein involved in outer membrane biogenesis
MKKLIKIGAVLAVVGVALLAISSTALHLLLPPERAKKLVLDQLRARLKREVRIG